MKFREKKNNKEGEKNARKTTGLEGVSKMQLKHYLCLNNGFCIVPNQAIEIFTSSENCGRTHIR